MRERPYAGITSRKFRHAALTHVGCVRESNEDSYLVLPVPHGHLYAVADGMGGHAAGEVASKIAVEEMMGWSPRTLDTSTKDGMGGAFAVAHEAILGDMALHPGRRGMGTTLTAVSVNGSRAVVGHAGDSRLYWVRDGRGKQVTRDHKGDFGIANCLGVSRDAFTGADVEEVDLRAGDVLVLCTDGLADYLDARGAGDIVGSMPGAPPAEVAGRLVDFALSSGGRDNVTVIVVEVSE